MEFHLAEISKSDGMSWKMRANTAEIESTTNGVVFFERLYGKLFSPVLIPILQRWANARVPAIS